MLEKIIDSEVIDWKAIEAKNEYKSMETAQYKHSRGALLIIGTYGNDNKINVIVFEHKDDKLIKDLFSWSVREKAKLSDSNTELKVSAPLHNMVAWELNNKKLMFTILNKINTLISLSNIKKEIYAIVALGIKTNKKEFYGPLEQLVNDGNVEAAIASINSMNHIERNYVFLQLAQYCKKQNKFPEAICIYQEIEQDSPHYQEANEKSAIIVMQALDNIPDEGTGTESEQKKLERKRAYQEAVIKFMLRANNNAYQQILDKLFSEYCGFKGLTTPMIQGVGCDESSITALANLIFHSQEKTHNVKLENETLKKQNAQLIAQKALLETQLTKLTRAEQNSEEKSSEYDFSLGFLSK